MLNSSPSNSFSVKLKLSLTDSILVLTQQKQKQWRTSKKQTQTHFQKNHILKQSNTTTHFQKLFFSNNQTQQPKRNNEINKPKTHLGFCSDQIGPGFCWSCWDQIGTVRKVLLELIGWSVVLSHFVLFHISRSPPNLT